MVPLTGNIVPVGAGESLSIVEGRVVHADDQPVAEARIGIGGPLDGKVIRSASSRLDYRKPTVTIVHDMMTGQAETSADIEPLLTYVPKTIMVLGVRAYRIWISEKWWTDSRVSLTEFEAEVLLRLIDADPREVRQCRQLNL